METDITHQLLAHDQAYKYGFKCCVTLIYWQGNSKKNCKSRVKSGLVAVNSVVGGGKSCPSSKWIPSVLIFSLFDQGLLMVFPKWWD